MDIHLNTLYVVARGASVRRDHQTVSVWVERKRRLAVPIHQLEAIAVFGSAHVTPGVLHLCADQGVAVTFLSESGRLLSRVDAPGSGNVLLRREQFRQADRPECRAAVAKAIVAGKLHNTRSVLLRGAREADASESQIALQNAANHLAETIAALENSPDVDTIRGREGDAGRVYFHVFSHLVRQNREAFRLMGRSRRPPRDRINALLSFVYALLLNDCCSAAAAAGLDVNVGFLHVDRPGRPGLALDLMEEFRPLLADRLVLTLVNRQQIQADDFLIREGGSVQLTESARRTILSAFQQRKREETTHPLLGQKVPVGRLPFLQARILARHLRGDLPSYVPCVLKS